MTAEQRTPSSSPEQDGNKQRTPLGFCHSGHRKPAGPQQDRTSAPLTHCKTLNSKHSHCIRRGETFSLELPCRDCCSKVPRNQTARSRAHWELISATHNTSFPQVVTSSLQTTKLPWAREQDPAQPSSPSDCDLEPAPHPLRSQHLYLSNAVCNKNPVFLLSPG